MVLKRIMKEEKPVQVIKYLNGANSAQSTQEFQRETGKRQITCL